MSPLPRDVRRWTLQITVVALAYYLAARLGLALALDHTNATAVWPPSGIALAAALRWGYRVWPGIALGAFWANTLAFHGHQVGDWWLIALVSAGIATGNTLEALAGRWLLVRLIGTDELFTQPRHVLLFLIVALAISVVSALVGPSCIALTEFAPRELYTTVWLTWWLGDSVGVLALTPLVLAWSRGPRFRIDGYRLAEGAALLALLVVSAHTAFGGWLLPLKTHSPLAFLPLPFLLWSAFRFGLHGATAAVTLVAGIAIWDTAGGSGAFVNQSLTTNDSLLLLQLYVGCLAVPILAMTATLARQRRMDAELLENEARLRLAMDAAQMGTWDWDLATGQVKWSSNLEAIHGLEPGAFGGTYADFLRGVHPEDRDSVEQAIAGTVQQRTEHLIEYRILWPDSSIHWLEGRGQLSCDADGKPQHMIGVCLDITRRKQAAEELQRSYSMLRAVIDGTTDAVYVKDAVGRYLMINTAGAQFLGKKVDEVIGKDDTGLFSEETARAIMEGDRSVMATGETQTYEDVGTAAGITRTYLSTKGPYRDAQGNVIGLIGISREITDRKQAEQRLVAEHAVARVLAESTDLENAAPHMLWAICQNLGFDVGVLWRVDAEAGLMRCVEVWHAPSVEVTAFERASRSQTFGRGEGLPGRIWAEKEPVWIPNIAGDPTVSRGAVARDVELRAAFGVPVHRNDEVLGALEFFSREIREPDGALMAMMESIGRQASQFIELRDVQRALHERDREFALARSIQLGLLPREPPVARGLEIGFASQAMQETGGDFLDFIPLPDGQLGVAIGDASGHGIAAALLITEARAYLRGLTETQNDLGTIIRLLNQFVVNDIEGGSFITLLLVGIDPTTRRLRCCSAGHSFGYVLDSRGEIKHVLESTGIPLGVEECAEYTVRDPVLVEPGDVAFFCTDGITEARTSDGRFYGIQRALKLIHGHSHLGAAEMVDALFQSVSDFTARRVTDDRSAIVIKVLDA